MITTTPLGDIMQQQRNAELPPQGNFLDRRCRHGSNISQRAGFDTVQNTHGKDGMLINGVTVVHIELHHRDDTPEIRHEFADKAAFIHQRKTRSGLRLMSGFSEKQH